MNCFLQSARYLCHQSASSRRSCSCHLLPRSPRPLPDSSSSSLLLRLNPPILFCHPPLPSSPSSSSRFLRLTLPNLPCPAPPPSPPLPLAPAFSSVCSSFLRLLFFLRPSPLTLLPSLLRLSLPFLTKLHHITMQPSGMRNAWSDRKLRITDIMPSPISEHRS